MTNPFARVSRAAQPAVDQPLSPLPPAGHIFDLTRRLTPTDLDGDDCLRPDGIARHLHETGIEHLAGKHLLAENPHWTVRRTVVDIVEPIAYPAQLRLRRWCSGLASMWSSMRLRIDADNGGLVETEGFWVHLNPDTGNPARISDRYLQLMATTAAADPPAWRPWLRAPLPASIGERFPLRRTDFDPGGRVAATAYWAAIHEYTTGASDLTARPHRYVLESHKPVRTGEHIDVYTDRGRDGLTVWFAVDRDVRALAQLRRAP
ncbi:acyl-ACP thioesterase domain-containing protein [Nocardia sp. alder85J]|uniref:acyl-ACP thioesterase domain-containing protein n=1 Tax=Nocardia sp. alder85J TaxID=2862949 RepID=UPI001CD40A31|nr:acyl-ACP thioesterase domain-containing protein [Nocardia sp. alder85J]MCX4092918.1 thioesterase [Nocardia sp. alder85J]